MVDQSLVTSGFDIEVLLSERYLRYALLAQVEAGLLPLEIHIVDDDEGLDVNFTIHPPVDYQRRYDPDPNAPLPAPVDGSFDTFILIGDPEGANLIVSVVVDVVDNISGDDVFGQVLDLVLRVGLTAEVDDRGFESDHRLSIELVRLEGVLVALAPPSINMADATAELKARFDRTIPFGVADNQAVQRVATRLFPLDPPHPRAFGVYLNLALRDGPEPDAFLADRGDVDAAANFLEDGRDLAFATGSHLLGLLGDDARFRMAEETTPGSGRFSFPLREDPTDPEGKVIGTIDDITIGPESPGTNPSGRLLIDVHGGYDIEFLRDDVPTEFHLRLFLTPFVDNGILRWDVEVSIDVNIAASIPAIVTMIVGTVFLGPAAGVTIFALLVAADLVVDALATAVAADRATELFDATFLDALPQRLTVAQRRWDPLYLTRHQVVALIDGAFVVNELGLAFDGDAVLDREPAVIGHVVIRDEERDDSGAIVRLRYRVRDLDDIDDDIVAVGPGNDRRSFAAVDPAVEPNLVALTIAEVEDRMATERLFHPVLYVAFKIHLVSNAIDQLLLISNLEIREASTELIDAFREATEAQVRADAGGALTDDDVTALVDAAQEAYQGGAFRDDLRAAVDRVLRFDAAPHELAELQDRGVLVIAGKEIIRMHSGTVYYRDRPDVTRFDNLLALRRYTPPYDPDS